jgi:hypothetical protein
MADTNTAKWELLPVCTSLNGRHKSAPICCENHRVAVNLPPTKAPFGASNFDSNEKIRMNLDLSCTDEYTAFLEKVDQWALGELAKAPTKFFKKDLDKTEIRAAYKSCATQHEKNGQRFPDTMRVKIMLEGPNKLRCWTPDRQPREIPEDFRLCTITPQVVPKSIWLMGGNSAGVLFECYDCIVEEMSVECPF